MAIDDTQFRPADTDNNLLRKILQSLQGVGGGIIVSGGGGGGGGGAVTIADGADVAEGAKADVKVVDPDASGTVVAILKGILQAVNVPATGSTSLTTIDNSLTDIDNSIGDTNTQLTNVNTKLDTISATIGQQRGALTNGSGSITTGGTSQAVFALNASRKYFFFQNISTETMWINFGVAAVQDQPSLEILPHASFVMETFFVSTEAINVISATTGSKFVAKQA